MDCRHFRKHHLAYLDDTLSGDMMAEAQRHILGCNACAAHDTLVRRSLMIARSMPTIEPSSEFQRKLRERLAACRDERSEGRRDVALVTTATLRAEGSERSAMRFPLPIRSPRAIAAMAFGAALGTMAWRGFSANEAPVVSMRPVVASQPVLMQPQPMISPALISVMSTGNPVWPAALMIEEAPTQFVSTDFRLVSDR